MQRGAESPDECPVPTSGVRELGGTALHGQRRRYPHDEHRVLRDGDAACCQALPGSMHYDAEANDKHKHPWQRGRKGSLCPRHLTPADAQRLLEDGETTLGRLEPRWATDGERAYAARQHREGSWHGYPTAWKEVPSMLVQRWIDGERVSRRDVRKYWDDPETS